MMVCDFYLNPYDMWFMPLYSEYCKVSRWHLTLPNLSRFYPAGIQVWQVEDCVIFVDQTVDHGIAEADNPYKLLVHRY